MTLRYFYMDPDAVPIEMTTRVWTPLESNEASEEFNAVQWDLIVEDPDSDLVIYPWRRWYVLDDDAPTDHTVVWMGFNADQHVKRSEIYPRTPTSRAWHLTMTDVNYNVSRFLFDHDTDNADRPEETDLERIAWFLTVDDIDTGGMDDNVEHIATSGGVLLDEQDFAPVDSVPQGPKAVLQDMIDQSGRQGFIGYDETKGPPDFEIPEDGELFIFYDRVSAEHWTSELYLTNDEDEIDPSNGIFPLLDDPLDYHPDPTRINHRLIAAYDGGFVDVDDPTISEVFTIRETTAYMELVKSEAQAEARAERMLQQGRTPADRVDWGYETGPEYLNALMSGQAFQYRATHLGGLSHLGVPDYAQEGGVRVRSVGRSVRQIGPARYQVTGKAVPAYTSVLSCAAVIGDIDAWGITTDGPLNSNSISNPPLTNVTGPYAVTGDLAVSFIAVGATGWNVGHGEEMVLKGTTDWNSLGVQPGDIGGTHTETNVAYRDIGSSEDVTWAGSDDMLDSFGFGGGHIINFTIPGATFVQESTSIFAGIASWATPLTPGNMVVICEIAEGPSGWSSIPSPDPVEVIVIPNALINSNSDMRVYAICVVEDMADINVGGAGSSHWAYAFEVSFS